MQSFQMGGGDEIHGFNNRTKRPNCLFYITSLKELLLSKVVGGSWYLKRVNLLEKPAVLLKAERQTCSATSSAF